VKQEVLGRETENRKFWEVLHLIKGGEGKKQKKKLCKNKFVNIFLK
jgi:hypothetical protein